MNGRADKNGDALPLMDRWADKNRDTLPLMVGGLSEARQQFKMAATFSNERKDGNFRLKQRRKTSDSDTGRTWRRREGGEEDDGGGGMVEVDRECIPLYKVTNSLVQVRLPFQQWKSIETACIETASITRLYDGGLTL